MVEWWTRSLLFSRSSWLIRFWINSLTSLSIRTGASNFANSGKFGVFETTSGGGKFKLWSILGIFLGTGVTSVVDCLGARLLDGNGVGPKLNTVGTAVSFSLRWSTCVLVYFSCTVVHEGTKSKIWNPDFLSLICHFDYPQPMQHNETPLKRLKLVQNWTST